MPDTVTSLAKKNSRDLLKISRVFIGQRRALTRKKWLPPRDSNPDNVLQRHVSYH